MNGQLWHAQIVQEEPENAYIDPEIEAILLEEDRVNAEIFASEPGCIFDSYEENMA